VTRANLTGWPYPFWIAHRGAGEFAPENTMAAFSLGAQHGFRMFECDVKLSADGQLFLLHDSTLTRTTNHRSANNSPELIAGDCDWAFLATLDAGSWHSTPYAGEPLPTLSALALWCIANKHHLNIEIKPTPGTEALTGEAVARVAAHLWRDELVPPLLSSFAVDALQAAKLAQPTLPRGLLLDKLKPGWLDTAQSLGCVAVICNHQLWTEDTVACVKAAGLKALSYTVNTASDAKHLQDLGTDGIITDRMTTFNQRA